MNIQSNLEVVSQGMGPVATPVNAPGGGASFSEVFEGIKGKLGLNEAHNATVGIQQQLLSQTKVSPQQLLLYQIKVHELHLRTELLSKVGETLTSSVRKLQSSQ